MNIVCKVDGHRPWRPDEYSFIRCTRCNAIWAGGTWEEAV